MFTRANRRSKAYVLGSDRDAWLLPFIWERSSTYWHRIYSRMHHEFRVRKIPGMNLIRKKLRNRTSGTQDCVLCCDRALI